MVTGGDCLKFKLNHLTDFFLSVHFSWKIPILKTRKLHGNNLTDKAYVVIFQ